MKKDSKIFSLTQKLTDMTGMMMLQTISNQRENLGSPHFMKSFKICIENVMEILNFLFT